jgi:hypothetical protein
MVSKIDWSRIELGSIDTHQILTKGLFFTMTNAMLGVLRPRGSNAKIF